MGKEGAETPEGDAGAPPEISFPRLGWKLRTGKPGPPTVSDGRPKNARLAGQGRASSGASGEVKPGTVPSDNR